MAGVEMPGRREIGASYLGKLAAARGRKKGNCELLQPIVLNRRPAHFQGEPKAAGVKCPVYRPMRPKGPEELANGLCRGGA